MPDYLIDFSTVTRGKQRSQRDITRFWNSRFSTFVRAGFTEREATWAANNGLSPRDKQVKRILRSRMDMVAFYMRHGRTWEEAVDECSEDLASRLDRYDIDELDLFYEVSP